MSTLVALVALLLLALATARGLQRRVLYPRPPAGPAPALPPRATQALLGPSSDWEAFLLRPAPADAPLRALIFTHGNGELIDDWLEPFREPTRWGVAVLLVEYPGYGRSGGTPTQKSITEAVVAAYDFLAAQPDVDASRIVAYGRSLGGGAACALARERPLSGLILESTFTSVRALARGFGMPGRLVLDPFDNVSTVADLEIPVLVIHGERDDLIPVEHGESLAEAAGVELVRLPCGHNDCPRPWREVRAFLANESVRAATRGDDS